jgi:predicted Ser/Thr protein kinase
VRAGETDTQVPGSLIGGYRIEAVIGRGGMGVVYRARQEALDRIVALKLLAPDLAGDAAFRARFQREAKVAASIEHPNVLPVHEAGEQDGALFIAMRYVDGTDLGAVIESGPPRLHEVLRVIREVAAALDAAHARGLVHRDVKPANILISAADGHVYLGDFGLTKFAGSHSITETGQFVGTVDYVSPEQVQGQRVDARTDIYALGCVLFHALTGRVPYPRDTAFSTLWAHVNDPPPPVTEARPGLPRELDAVFVRAMAKDPADRYPSAGDLGRAALAAGDGDATIPAERSVARGGAAPTLRGSSPLAALPWWQRRDRPVLIGALVLVAIGIGAAFVIRSLTAAGKTSHRQSAAGHVASRFSVGRGAFDLAATPGTVWILSNARNGLVEILSTATRKEQKRHLSHRGMTFTSNTRPVGIATDGSAAWVVFTNGYLEEYGSPTLGGRSVRKTDIADIASGSNSLWTAGSERKHGAWRPFIALESSKVGVKTFDIGGSGVTDMRLAISRRFVWLYDEVLILRFDPRTATFAQTAIPTSFQGEPLADFVVGDTGAWLRFGNTIEHVDPASGRTIGQPISVSRVNARSSRHPHGGAKLALGFGSVWVPQAAGNAVVRIDASSGKRVGEPIKVGSGVNAITVGDGAVWVLSGKHRSLAEIKP